MSSLRKAFIKDESGNPVWAKAHLSSVYDDNGTPLSTTLSNIESTTYVPTLNLEPSSSTTTYTKDGVTHNFEIGQFCRVSNSGSYDFYQLTNLVLENNTPVATWQKVVKSDNAGIVTIPSAPTSTTTTYTKDGEIKDFEIGQFCRVANAQSETGYDFYQMQDLTITNEGEENETRTASWYKLKDDNDNTTYKLNINGTEQGGGTTSLGTVYAPTTAGTEGQMLIANASGVPAWGSKPSYSLSEIGVTTSVVAVTAATSSSCTITGAGNSGKMQTIIYTNNSGSSKVVTVPTTYATPDGAAIELEVPNGGYCEVNYLNINGTIYARGL